jgi:hypothetical protein
MGVVRGPSISYRSSTRPARSGDRLAVWSASLRGNRRQIHRTPINRSSTLSAFRLPFSFGSRLSLSTLRSKKDRPSFVRFPVCKRKRHTFLFTELPKTGNRSGTLIFNRRTNLRIYVSLSFYVGDNYSHRERKWSDCTFSIYYLYSRLVITAR